MDPLFCAEAEGGPNVRTDKRQAENSILVYS